MRPGPFMRADIVSGFGAVAIARRGRLVRRARLLHEWGGLCLLTLMCLATPTVTSAAAGGVGTPAQRRVERTGPLVIAHRGLSSKAPENTLPAFRLALAARADLVELDYHLSRDGVAVVLHDATLDRTTDATNRWQGSGFAVAERGAEEIRNLDAGGWFGAAFLGTQVPTLSEALAVIQPTGCTLIERKSGDAGGLVRLLREAGFLGGVVVQSFDWAFVKACHQEEPSLVLGALGPPSHREGRELALEERMLSPEYLGAIAETGARLVVWNKQVTAASVAEAHRQGFRVWVYTIDDPQRGAELVALGVDGIITNDPETLRRRLLPEVVEGAPEPRPKP